jgi:hypothetical protein
MCQKDRRRNTSGSKFKRKYEIKYGRIFGLLKIENFIQMIFIEKFFKIYTSEILFCSSCHIEQIDTNEI